MNNNEFDYYHLIKFTTTSENGVDSIRKKENIIKSFCGISLLIKMIKCENTCCN